MTTSNDTPETITIQLPRGYLTIIDVADSDLSEYKWGCQYCKDGRVYARRSDRKTMQNPPGNSLHKIIFERVLGRKLVLGELVDHIDNDPLNNRRKNLRLATKSQNGANSKRKVDNSTGYKGVIFESFTKRYKAAIRINGKTINLGRYDTPEEAHEAYKQAAIKYHGEFARFE